MVETHRKGSHAPKIRVGKEEDEFCRREAECEKDVLEARFIMVCRGSTLATMRMEENCRGGNGTASV